MFQVPVAFIELVAIIFVPTLLMYGLMIFQFRKGKQAEID